MFIVSKENTNEFSPLLKHHFNKYLMHQLFPIQHVYRWRNKKCFIYSPLHFNVFLSFPPSHAYLLFCTCSVFFFFFFKVLSRLLSRSVMGCISKQTFCNIFCIILILLKSTAPQMTFLFAQRRTGPVSYQASLQQFLTRHLLISWNQFSVAGLTLFHKYSSSQSLRQVGIFSFVCSRAITKF